MEDISFKLTVIFLLCPIFSLTLLFFVLFYFGYREAINLVLSTFTVMSVIILVWERVHDLSLKKLEYIYEHVLREIHKKIYEQKVDLESNFGYPIYLKDIKFLIKKLKRTGKILGLVSLYPSSFIRKLEGVSEVGENYMAEINKLERFSKDVGIQWNPRILWKLVYSKIDELKSCDKQTINKNEKFLKLIKEKSPNIISNLKEEWEKLIEQLNVTILKLESFFEKNALPIPKYEKRYETSIEEILNP